MTAVHCRPTGENGPRGAQGVRRGDPGGPLRIEVKNRLNRRVGLVIAVDGRNIISGTKSWLRNNERMYILNHTVRENSRLAHGSGSHQPLLLHRRSRLLRRGVRRRERHGGDRRGALSRGASLRAADAPFPDSPSCSRGHERKMAGSFDKAESAPAAGKTPASG